MVDAGEDLLEATIRGDLALRQQGLWTYLLQRRGNEGFNYIQDQLGYYSVLKNWNAADAIAFLGRAFKPGQDFMRLKNRFEALPHAVAMEAGMEGAKLHLEHRLRLVERHADGKLSRKSRCLRRRAGFRDRRSGGSGDAAAFHRTARSRLLLFLRQPLRQNDGQRGGGAARQDPSSLSDGLVGGHGDRSRQIGHRSADPPDQFTGARKPTAKAC